jgi:hypothetical protein
MVPLIPLRPQPTVTSDPPASRRATWILNVAFVVVAAVIVLSNLLFFPLGPGGTRRVTEAPPDRAPPTASAPVILDLPSPKPPDAQPAPESAAGEEDASALPRIEPAAPPPASNPVPEVPAPPSPDVVASLPHASNPVPEVPALPPDVAASPPPASNRVPEAPAPPPPDVVASLPPAGNPVPEAPAPPPPDIVASLPPASNPAPEVPPATPAPSEPTQAAAAAAAALPADEIEALTRRGDALLVTGDIIAARLAYERAAHAGSAAAATGVGKTFDPLFLAAAGVRGIQGNPFEAAAWYRLGSSAGDLEAEARLEALRRQFPE